MFMKYSASVTYQSKIFCRWRRKYGGMATSEVRRLKDLEQENTRLKRIVADQQLCIQMLKDVLTIVDEFTREGLMIYAHRPITSTNVIDCLSCLYGKPDCIKSDNGPEFIAKQVHAWLAKHHVQVRYIDPGSPWQNGHNESFNGIFRDGCLNRWSFYSLSEARRVVDQRLENTTPCVPMAQSA